MDEGTRVFQEQLEHLLAEGFILPFSIVMLDTRGHFYGGVFAVNAASEGAFEPKFDTLGDDSFGVPHCYLIVDSVGQAASIQVTYRGETGEVNAEGLPIARLHARLHRIT
jgi:hypothetical protein